MQPLNLNGDSPWEEAIEDCEAILEWAEENPDRNFDTAFVESVQEQVEDREFVSDKQKAALDKIRETFGI